MSSAEIGYVATKQATLSKSRSTISANGKVDPDGNLNLVLQGRNFQIEQVWKSG